MSEISDVVNKFEIEKAYYYGCKEDLEKAYKQGRVDAFADCILENGKYCWQECCETEHCKECKWLGNGDTTWFEQMQKGGREWQNLKKYLIT